MAAAQMALVSLIVCLCSIAVMRGIDRFSASSSLEMPQWMEQAAKESAQASRSLCSGHGMVYEDSEDLVCECSDCYTGTNCSELLPDCIVDADSGDPTFLEPFWMEHGVDAGVFISSSYRMSYLTKHKHASPASKYLPLVYMIKELENHIRELHRLTGNAVTEDKYFVLGTGSIQLIAAAIDALSDTAANKPAAVVTKYPYYMVYKYQVDVLSSSKFYWGGDAIEAFEKKALDPSSVVEIVASPNNPDASILEPVFKGTEARIIHDKAYYWPHFTAITEAVDEDIMLFSLSKATGHAGSRLGWAFVRDIDVYKKMLMYVTVTTIGISRESQLRASRLIRTVLDGYKSASKEPRTRLFDYGHDVLQYRWRMVADIFEGSTRFSIQKIPPQHCTFFKKEVSPSPAYVWIRCEQDEDCNSVFQAAGIRGHQGPAFGVDASYLRLTVLRRHDQFELLVQKLGRLVSNAREEQD